MFGNRTVARRHKTQVNPETAIFFSKVDIHEDASKLYNMLINFAFNSYSVEKLRLL